LAAQGLVSHPVRGPYFSPFISNDARGLLTRPNKPHEKEHLEHQRLVNQWSAPVNTERDRMDLNLNETTANYNKSPERYN